MSENPMTHCEHGIDLAYRCIDCIEAERDALRARVEELETENLKLRIGFSDMRGAARFQRSALESLRASMQAVAWTFSREDFKALAFDLRRIASSGIMANEKPLTVEFARMVRHVCTTAAHMLDDAHDNYLIAAAQEGE